METGGGGHITLVYCSGNGMETGGNGWKKVETGGNGVILQCILAVMIRFVRCSGDEETPRLLQRKVNSC